MFMVSLKDQQFLVLHHFLKWYVAKQNEEDGIFMMNPDEMETGTAVDESIGTSMLRPNHAT